MPIDLHSEMRVLLFLWCQPPGKTSGWKEKLWASPLSESNTVKLHVSSSAYKPAYSLLMLNQGQGRGALRKIPERSFNFILRKTMNL